MAADTFAFEELTLSQNASIEALYRLYCQNFPLPDEQESPENFRRCLELNEEPQIQARYGPYHEFYLTIRKWNDLVGRHDDIVGGLIFGVTTSPAHQQHGFACSTQVIYLFREADDALKHYLLTTAELENVIAKYARIACDLPRFATVIGGSPADRIAMFFEVNNPARMSPEEMQIDRDLSHLHPALRYTMWKKNHTRPLKFRYVQPPLSADQSAARYLDLFAVEGDRRLIADRRGNPGIPGAVVAAHLRQFFCISVLKGQHEAIETPCLPPPIASIGDDQPALTVDEYCHRIGDIAFIPLIAYDDSELSAIELQAREASFIVAKDLARRSTKSANMPAALRYIRRLFIRYWPRLKHILEVIGLWLGAAIGVCLLLGVLVDPHVVEEMDRLHVMLASIVAAITVLVVAGGLIQRYRRRAHDRSPIILSEILKSIAAENGPFKGRHPAIPLREILRDRAANHLTVHAPIGSTDHPSEVEVAALSYFLASRTLAPKMAEIGLGRFDSRAIQEVDRIKRALHAFPMGALQAWYDYTPWHAYYTCIFPIRPDALAGAYRKLEDFDAWLDANVATTLRQVDEGLRSAQLTGADKEVCLFVSHILDRPWDEADPGSLFDMLDRRFGATERRRVTTLERAIAPHWKPEAEIACARMLAVISHLALILSRVARGRHITTDLYCRCTVVIHLTSEPSIEMMRSLGFRELPRPSGEASEPEDEETVLEGTLLRATIDPNGYSELLARKDHATSSFFGVISDVAAKQRVS